MLRNLSLAALVVALCGFFLSQAWAMEAPATQTFKGTLVCGKCMLKDKACTTCQTVLQVKEGDKTASYYLVDNEVSKQAHGKVCHKSMDGVTITGTVADKDGQMWLTATKIEFAE